jgi:lysophospholipase L1-like esterase
MLAAAATSALLLGACAASAASGNGPQIDARPDTTGPSRTVGVNPSRPSTTTTTTTVPAEPVITDNRVYLVGDSITESISSRYSGAVCDALNPLGWAVTVDAAMGRQTTDAVQSLRAHLTDVGQVLVVLIGHNDGIDPENYKTQLDRLIALVPDVRRIYLLTNYQFEKGRDRMNAVLQQEAAADGTGGPDDRIELVDWNTVVSGVKGAIRQDGLHLTSIGQEALAGTIASALGLAPGATPPTTTTTVASDSTASRRRTSSKSTTASSARCTTERASSTSGSSASGSRGSGGSGSGGSGTGGSGSGGSSKTTTIAPPPAPTTSPGPSPSGTAAPPTSKPGSGKPPGSTTAPPGTNPPGTNPPGTSPPATSPHLTSPPTT